MKTLTKISINPEKSLKNEELINLIGGGYCTTVCYGDWGQYTYGYLLCEGECTKECNEAFGNPPGPDVYGVPSSC